MLPKFIENSGWYKAHINPFEVYTAQFLLEEKLRDILGIRNVILATYHEHVQNDEDHLKIQTELTKFVHEKQLGFNIASDNMFYLKNLFDGPINIQKHPHLRIARPHKPQDNIGFHKDTSYGGHPQEVSCVIPLVNLDWNSALKVLPGSHKVADEEYGIVQQKQSDRERGDAKHFIGVPYAPQVCTNLNEDDMQAVPLRIGEALMFSLATLHGQKVNKSPWTRWSIDLRLVNAEHACRHDRYEALC